MCISAAMLTAFGSALGGAAAIYSAANKPKAPDIPAPTPPPQAPVLPAASAARGKPPAGDPTLLTGPQGVPTDTLTLGRQTLLGM